jgi:TRAP-type uncharacterized transport system substrate-binding protein
MLVASPDLDADTVHTITAALYSQRQFLNRAHPMLGSIPLVDASENDTGIPLHPGAERYFEEGR